MIRFLAVRGLVSAGHRGSVFPPHSIQFHSCPGKRTMIWSGLAELGLHVYVRVWDPGVIWGQFLFDYLSALKSRFRHFFTLLYTILIIWMQKNWYLVPMYLCIWPFEFLKKHDKVSPQHFLMFSNLQHILHILFAKTVLMVSQIYEKMA